MNGFRLPKSLLLVFILLSIFFYASCTDAKGSALIRGWINDKNGDLKLSFEIPKNFTLLGTDKTIGSAVYAFDKDNRTDNIYFYLVNFDKMSEELKKNSVELMAFQKDIKVSQWAESMTGTNSMLQKVSVPGLPEHLVLLKVKNSSDQYYLYKIENNIPLAAKLELLGKYNKEQHCKHLINDLIKIATSLKVSID
ncbi:hypothetical protein NBE98_14980 [Clostridium swellfunianum]|uniref:hypothetical protein n=1 Tax=Clostridium swellfunianum TaxID=1367462 RepID=UPI00202E55AA|nr:hypothetical protein [Clostridium swellfunianum]MCM0649669.1 hypothetical protein [Clostridium swellfunianum]